MLRPTAASENCGSWPAAAMASLPLLELDFALDDEDFAELLELDFTELLDLAELELDFTLLELDFAELDDAGGSELLEATLELLWIAAHFADTDKSSDTVAGISVTMSLPHFQPAKE